MAGNKGIQHFLGSLFKKKEQAPSTTYTSPLDKSFDEWAAGKGYLRAESKLTQTAALLGTDYKTLLEYCQQRFGMDFRSWRSMMRVNEAKELLVKMPNHSFSTIGRMVGFNDRSNFTKQFEIHAGMTPSMWRKRHGVK